MNRAERYGRRPERRVPQRVHESPPPPPQGRFTTRQFVVGVAAGFAAGVATGAGNLALVQNLETKQKSDEHVIQKAADAMGIVRSQNEQERWASLPWDNVDKVLATMEVSENLPFKEAAALAKPLKESGELTVAFDPRLDRTAFPYGTEVATAQGRILFLLSLNRQLHETGGTALALALDLTQGIEDIRWLQEHIAKFASLPPSERIQLADSHTQVPTVRLDRVARTYGTRAQAYIQARGLIGKGKDFRREDETLAAAFVRAERSIHSPRWRDYMQKTVIEKRSSPQPTPAPRPMAIPCTYNCTGARMYL